MVQVSPNVKPSSVAITLINFIIRDHKEFIVYFVLSCILGHLFILMCKIYMRRLVTFQPLADENYLSQVEYMFNQHRIKEKVKRLEKS